jgi:hypothetical protein
VKDLQRLVEITDHGVTIASVNGGEVDLSTATGKMTARILGSVAEQESEHKGERRRRANLERAISGEWRADGPRVFGYTQGGEPLEPEASAVAQAAEDVLNGTSLRSIATAWNKAEMFTPKATTGKQKGGAKWSNLQLRRMLMRPVYCGQLHYTDDEGNRQVTPGTWTPLFDEDTHNALVQLLTDPARRPASAFLRKYMGSGVYVCGVCGEKLYAGKPNGRRAMAYLCRNGGHLGRAGAPIDLMVEAVVLGVLTESPNIARKLIKTPGVDTVALRVKRDALAKQKDELATLFADGILDGPAVRREAVKLTERMVEIEGQLTEAARRSTAATLLKDGPDRVRQHWDEASPDIKGKVVDELCTVTVKPQPGGWRSRGFDPDLILIEPKIKA